VLRPIRKEKLSNYHESFYRNKKRSSPVKWLLLLVSIVVIVLVSMKTSYAKQFSKNEMLNELGSGQMLFAMAKTDGMKNENKHRMQGSGYQPAILLNSSASFEINGLIAEVTLTQSFINQNDDTVNGLYAFPLPENSAVNYLHIQVADRIIEGKIMETAQAKKVFEKAKRSGKKASLVEQHRPNLFTNNIANIAAHEQVTVTIKYFQHIDYIDGQFSIRFPMKITPRYQPKASTNSMFSALPSIFTSQNKHASNNIHLTVKLNAGVELEAISSPSHSLNIKDYETRVLQHQPFAKNTSLAIGVGNVQVAMDKDFILQWQPSYSTEPRLSVFKQQLDGEVYSLAMLLPPSPQTTSSTEQQSFVRDITFIIDTSGSMQGQSIEQAKQSLIFALQTLTENDSFNIIAFESSYHQAFNSTVMATTANLMIARQFIAKLDANGGTQMYQPLATALAMPTTAKQHSTAMKQVMFITDGAVSNELALFKLIHDTPHIPRLFTVGIGSAPNGYFMRKAAQFGRGSYTYIGKVNEVKLKMSSLLEKISRPVLRNIAIQFQPLHLGSIEQYPKKIPDLYYGDPLVIAFKTAMMPQSMQVFGEQATKSWHQEISLAEQYESKGITPIWARAKIEDLLDGLVTGKSTQQVKNKVVTTSLLHQVMSPYTSFIAIEQENNLTDSNEAKKATPFPKTATGWQLPFISGVLLLLLSLVMQARRAIKITKQKIR